MVVLLKISLGGTLAYQPFALNFLLTTVMF
jgi:hypothetical protein